MTTVLSHTVVRWSLPILTLAWAGFLFRVSTFDRGVLPSVGSAGFPNLLITPALHIGVYGLLAALLVLSIWAAWPRMTRLLVPLTASFVAATAYGAVLELYQSKLSTRSGAWDEAAYNAIGAAVALAVLAGLHRWRGPAPRP